MDSKFSFYDWLMNPLEKKVLHKVRRTLMARPRGVVLEIGAGTGANLPFYRYQYIDQLDILDLSIENKIKDFDYPEHLSVRLLEGEAESLPFQDHAYDYVVISLVLCSVIDLPKSLSEVMRVLKPGGRFIFIEHILPQENALRGLFQKLTPLWKRMAHNCHLNRETLDAIEAAGFDQLELFPVFKDIFVGGVAQKPYEMTRIHKRAARH